MSQILVQPQQLRQVTDQLRSSAQKIDQALQAIDNDINRLKGDAFLGNRAASLQSHYVAKRDSLLKARQIILSFAEDLVGAADLFERADQEQLLAILPSSAGFTWDDGWVLPVLPLRPDGQFPDEGIPWRRIFPFLSPDRKLQLPDWLERKINSIFKPSEIPSPVSISSEETPEKPASGFGQLLQEQPVGSNGHDPSPEANIPEVPAASDRQETDENSVPVKSQGNLYGGAGCAPTSVSMVLEYYHNQNAANQTVSADDLIKLMDKGDGTYGKGISLSNLTDELSDLGYKNITQQVGADYSALSNAIQGGPVIVTTGVKIVGPGTVATDVPRSLDGPGNTIHAMVVTGMDDTNVNVNDPWSGQALQIPKETFDKMWSRGSNGMYAIRP